MAELYTTDSFIPSKKLTLTPKTYYPHWNMTKPFRVTIGKDAICIKKYNLSLGEDEYNSGVDYDDSDEDIVDPYDIEVLNLLSGEFKGYWYGFDSSVYESHHNTILIKLNDHKYIYVSGNVIQFETTEPIIDYISCMGNNDVPYPVAYSDNYVYFIQEREFIQKDGLPTEATVANAEQLYLDYYNYDKKNKKYPIKKMKNLKILTYGDDNDE